MDGNLVPALPVPQVLRYVHLATGRQNQDSGVGRGALGHGFPFGPRRRPLRLFGALQSRACLQGKCSWRAPSNDEKSLRKVPPCVYKENLVGGRPQEPSGAFQRRKVAPKCSSNDDRTAPSLGELAPS